MKKIIHFFRINAAPEAVDKALTTEGGLSAWWTTRVKIKEGQHPEIHFTFAGDFNPVMRVVKAEQGKYVSWQCVAGHDKWQDNTFSFELRSTEGGTDVMFVQDYARELSDEIYGGYNFNWGYYLNSLKMFCEKGVGVPHDVH